jgi:hypothetical protein
MNTAIIIQGPTQFYKKIIKSYAGFGNVLWCTWKKEPIEVIKQIEKAGIRVYQIDEPLNAGNWNVNYQCKSTYEGLLKAKEVFDAEFYIKVRSDIVVSNVALFCERFYKAGNNEITFLGWVNKFGGFFLDYIVGGSFVEMKKFWQLQDISETGLPFPEKFLLNRYFNQTGEDSKMENLIKCHDLKLPYIDGISIKWLKMKIDVRGVLPEIRLNYTKNAMYYKYRFAFYDNLFFIKKNLAKLKPKHK